MTPRAASAQAPATVGRLAPSPTGGLHIGHARTFFVAWLAARNAGGRVVFRLEDLDADRARPGAAAASLEDLRWLGLTWDEGPDVGGPNDPYVQSQRAALYEETLERLKVRELVYPCTCTRKDIERAASAPHAEDEGPTYPGTCSGRRASDAAELGDRSFAWRFRAPRDPLAWNDLVRGPQALDLSQHGGDFVVGRSTGAAAYQLAVVVDDAAMGVTQVIRGDDLVGSTPRQLALYEALALPAPAFGHVPLVVDESGRRLAKRDHSIKLAALRERGADPSKLIGLLAQSCGWARELIPSSPHDWIGRAEVLRLAQGPWVVTAEMLRAL